MRGNSPRPVTDAPAAAASLGRERPGAIVVRAWQGDDRDRDGNRWSAETVVEANGVIGDPTAVSFGGGVWVAYPTAAGVRLRPVALGRQADATPGSERQCRSAKQWGGPLTFHPWRRPGPLSVARAGPAGGRCAIAAHGDRARDGPGARAADRQCRTRRGGSRPQAWPAADHLGRVNRRTRPTPSPGGNSTVLSPRAAAAPRFARGRVERGRRISFARRRLALLSHPNTGSMRDESTFSRADGTGSEPYRGRRSPWAEQTSR